MLRDRCALYAAGGRHGRADRAGGKAWRHHRLCVSRLVACGSRRPAADYVHGEPLWLARFLWRDRRRRCLELPAPALAVARGPDRRARRPQDLDGSRTQSGDYHPACDHHVADVRPVRRLHLYGTAIVEADTSGIGWGWGWYLRSTASAASSGLSSSAASSIWGAYNASVLCISLVLAGVAGWALSAGFLPADGLFGGDLGAWLRLEQFDASRFASSPPRRRLPRPRCRSTRRSCMWGRQSARRSAGCYTRTNFCAHWVMPARPLSSFALITVVSTRGPASAKS